MLTIERLKELGVDTESGLANCMNNEKFYIKMVEIVIKDSKFDKLDKAIADKSLWEAFEAAFALRGITFSTGLTPLFEPLDRLLNMLEHEKDADHASIYKPIKELRDQILREL